MDYLAMQVFFPLTMNVLPLRAAVLFWQNSVSNNNNGAVITMCIYSMLFHMDFNTGLFRRPTKCWSTHQLNSIQTETDLY